MKKVKMKSFKSIILWIVIPLVIGVVFFPRGLSEMIHGLQEPIDLLEVDYSGDLENLPVKGTVQCIYDYYCETTRDGVLDSREYIIDGGNDYYMGMYVKRKDMTNAEALMDASVAYLMGTDDDIEKVYDKQYEVSGVIKKMPDDSWDLYKEYMEWDTMTEEERAMHLPYYLSVNSKIGVASVNTWFTFITGAIAIAIAVFVAIKFFIGGYQKSITSYIQSSSNPEAAKEKVEAFFANTPEKNRIKFNREFISAQAGATTIFQDITKLLWLYQSKTTHKRNFITVGVSYELALCFTDGKRYMIPMKNEQSVQEVLEAIVAVAPWAIAGYESDLDTMFNKDLRAFCQLRYDGVMAEQVNLI